MRARQGIGWILGACTATVRHGKLFSLTKLRKQCRRLVTFLFGEANPNPNL